MDGRTIDHKTLEHLRFLALQRIKEGEKPSEVMRSLKLCRTTIYKWQNKYKHNGKKSLKSTKAVGPKTKLNNLQQKNVKKWINKKDPRDYGFESGLWTRKIIAELIEQKENIKIKLSAVSRLLSWLSITPQKPLRRAYERNPKQIAEWKSKVYPQIIKRAKRLDASVFFLDEAGIKSDDVLGKTYGIKGETPIVKTSGQRQKINAISAVNPRGAFWYSLYTGKFNSISFMSFLADFLKGRKKKVFLIVDGHPVHRSKAVSNYVKSLKGKLEIYFLPPYAPDLNPDEFVWNHLKKNGICKKPLRKNESLKERLLQDMKNIQNDIGLVKSFFRAPSVVYAKI
jgi:transposase